MEWDESNTRICIVGLGYVGLPLAVEFTKNGFKVSGFDIKEKRIQELKNNMDSLGEVSEEELKKFKVNFSSNPEAIKESNFIIVAVPTPVNEANKPDLTYLESASKLIGKNLSRNSIIVYESTVYPGATEEVCLPILEKNSGMRCGDDFKIGYSPERINPGDKEHTLDKIIKIVSGIDKETTKNITQVYNKIVKAGIHQAPTIKTAEAAKVIENIQRDLNIALVNELALIFNRLGIKTKDVLEAAGTKWNFHKYSPSIGPGGHCIPVDPYYLTFKAEQVGYNPQVILAGRAINNYMAKHVAELTIKGLNETGKIPKNSKILVLGLTFKENVKDHRNSRAVPLINYLKEYGVNVIGYDPLLDDEIVQEIFGIQNQSLENLRDIDGIILVSAHNQFKNYNLSQIKAIMRENPLLVDTKFFFDEKEVLNHGLLYKSI
ncbi:MAG: nucleotide sugar dehydrogenase [Nanoarchaeota archaeon]|nr:nucleotide sugar dehydrogenase [Nanoarchaeota archaeon]